MHLKNHEIVGAAETLATNAHIAQYRWDGQTPYITHPMAIAKSFLSSPPHIPADCIPICMATAWLHDVVEDTIIDLPVIIKSGFPPIVIHALDAITKRSNESYLEYILRVKKNVIAREVKIRDIVHNMSDLNDKQQQRKDKYLCALHILEDEKCWKNIRG